MSAGEAGGDVGALREVAAIPEGWESITYDPTWDVVLRLPVRSQVIVVTTGDGIWRTLDDQSDATPWDSMTAVQRAVLVARLRIWADLIDTPAASRPKGVA